MRDLSEAHKGRKWYVIYVKARHEKAVHDDLCKRGVESFLPLRNELHQWSDRKKWVEVPFYSCYVFTYITPDEKENVYSSDGFIKFLSSNGKPSVVPDWQIDSIRKVTGLYPEKVESLDKNCVGMSGEIVSGVLAGLRGEIVEISNEHYFTIRVEGLDRVLGLKVPADSIRISGPNSVQSGKVNSVREEASA